MAELTEKARRFLTAPNFASLATLMPDGSPQVSVMWVHVEDGRIAMNTAIGRLKHRNMLRDPRVAITVADREAPYDKVTIRGRVVEFVEGDAAEAHIDFLAGKYIGQSPYPWRKTGERRVKFYVVPEHVSDEA